MRYFKPSEFHGWYDQLAPCLKTGLDMLRERWGKPIHVSPVGAVAVGRHLGPDNTSQHNVDKWGVVRACDIMPEGIHTTHDARRFRQLAIDCGFTGIGFYPEWRPRAGFHVDCRINVEEGYVAQWGGVPNDKGKQDFIGIEGAIRRLPHAVG